MLCSCFFCFKQKTAYEMRISDWSSDVCSSDLRAFGGQRLFARPDHALPEITHVYIGIAAPKGTQSVEARSGQRLRFFGGRAQLHEATGQAFEQHLIRIAQIMIDRRFADPARSEEHTSELQSLMRISYAVFCLITKKNKKM